VVLAPSAAAEPAAPDDAVEAAAVPATVRQYAPFVYLAPRERFGPMSAGRFVGQASLSWAHDDFPCNEDHEVARRTTVDPTRLGNGGYEHQIANAVCDDHGDPHGSDELTRPRQGDKGDVPQNEGFYLNIPNSLHERRRADVPVFYEYEPRSFVTYWFFYAFNDSPGAELFDHEGDWERISVRLNDDDEAVTVAYYAHEGYCTRPWSEAGRHNGHPLAYSARGTHATYPWLGEYPIAGGLATDITGRGLGWATYERLRNARTRAWYGYGGAWGEVGERVETTGPLDPYAAADDLVAGLTG